MLLIGYNLLFTFSVYAIREAATKNLKKLVEKFGIDWAQVIGVILLIQKSQEFI